MDAGDELDDLRDEPDLLGAAEGDEHVASADRLGDFVETLALFLRTVPLYPEGHKRVSHVTGRLQDALALIGETTMLEVDDTSLRVARRPIEVLGPGGKTLREALRATGVSLLIFQAGAPTHSFARFARLLRANVRRCNAGQTTFAKLWSDPIDGIAVEERVYDPEAFQGLGGGAATPESPSPARTDGTKGEGVGWGADPDRNDEEKQPRAKMPRLPTASRDLRDLVKEDARATEALARVERALGKGRGTVTAKEAQPGAQAMDALEHVLRRLPTDIRHDPVRGLDAARRILDEFASSLEVGAKSDSTARAGLLLQAVLKVFPSRAPEDLPDPNAPQDPTEVGYRSDAAVPDGSNEELSAFAAGEARDLAALREDEGLLDAAGVLTHALLEETDEDRRDLLRRRLVSSLSSRPPEAPVPCLIEHLREAASVPAEKRDLPRLALLARAAEEAGLDSLPDARGWLSLDDAVTLFPSLLRTYVLGGGRVGAVARRVGRSAVLSSATALLAPGGVLHGDGALDRALVERSRDVLPLVEVLLGCRDTKARAAGLAALKSIDLPCACAVILRTVPDALMPDRLLRGLCEDGFEGRDSHRFDEDAVDVIARVLENPQTGRAGTSGAYATAALGAFPRDLVEPVLRTLLRRTWLVVPTQPREVRRTARSLLRGLAARGPSKQAVRIGGGPR